MRLRRIVRQYDSIVIMRSIMTGKAKPRLYVNPVDPMTASPVE